jgi:hypothetical protein
LDNGAVATDLDSHILGRDAKRVKKSNGWNGQPREQAVGNGREIHRIDFVNFRRSNFTHVNIAAIIFEKTAVKLSCNPV